jgi:type 1 glutamine amidotransferase
MMDATSDPSVFTDPGLQPYDVVLFLNTSGNTLDQDGQAAVHQLALINFMKKGRGFVGTHSAADTYQGTAWPWYVDFLGANMQDHANSGTQGTARFYMGRQHAILMAANTPDPWDRKEEWLTFTRDLLATAPPGITVLQTCTDTKFTTARPITWVHEMPIEPGAPRAGRMFYTGVGHLVDAFQEPAVMDLIIAGIKWAANRL